MEESLSGENSPVFYRYQNSPFAKKPLDFIPSQLMEVINVDVSSLDEYLVVLW